MVHVMDSPCFQWTIVSSILHRCQCFFTQKFTGELGADRIYAGQMFVLGKTDVGPTIQVCFI